MEWCAVLIVCSVDSGPLTKKQSSYILVAIHTGQKKWCTLLAVGYVYCGSPINK